MTGVDTDLATLLPSECPNCGRLHAGYDFNANPGPVQAELSRLREQRDYDVWNERILRRAAEARCARLQQALAGLESAVRILDVMLREPAAEGLMSAEDYRSYVQGAWLGVDEAAKKVREALAGLDTPAASCEKCRHAAHEPGRCGANVGTGYHGPVLCRCGADTPADSQEDKT